MFADLELPLSQLKHHSFGVNYQWDSTTHVLRGAVGTNKDLFILEHIQFPAHTLSSEVVELVKSYKSHYVYTNLYEPLREEIGGKCRQFSEELVQELDVFYENLRVGKRVNIAEGIELPSKDTSFTLCLKFLLKGILHKLTGSASGRMSLPTSSQVDVGVQYQQQNPWGY